MDDDIWINACVNTLTHIGKVIPYGHLECDVII